MNPISPRTYVEDLCAKNGKNSDPKIANLLEKDKTSFTDKECMLNELLQNADDQLTSDGEVHFKLSGRELVFSHFGKPFDQKDVSKICDYANANHNEKSEDSGKTGYKDIGFKSVFTIASRVDVISNEWRFCFNEHSPKWLRGPNENPFPWQICPIWCEEGDLTPEGKKALQENNKTTFVFQLYLGTDTIIMEKLIKWIETPQRLLFLKHVRSLIITIGEAVTNITCKDHQISVNGQLISTWKRADWSTGLTPEVKSYINQLSPFECPKRLKMMEKIPISFFFRYQEEQWVAAPNSRLYCTLPTGVDAGFPFLVDAPFLLNPSRESVLVNPFNIYLINQIATLNFVVVSRHLINSPSNLNILVPDILTEALSDDIRNCYKNCLQNLFQTQPFFPSYDGISYLYIKDAVVDLTGFVRLMHEAGLKADIFKTHVHPKLDSVTLLKRFPDLKQSTLSWVISLLPTMMSQLRNVPFCAKILTFFSTIFRSTKAYKPKDLTLFMTTQFVFDSQMNLCSLNELSLPLESKKYILPPEILGKVIHSDLLTPEIRAFLKDELKLPTQTPQTIIDTYANNLGDPSLKKVDNNRALIRLFYAFFQDRLISDYSLNKLKGFPLINELQQFVPSYQTYLSKTYLPAFPIEENSIKQILLSATYLDATDDLKQIRQFFSVLGVWEKCEFQLSYSINIKEALQIPYGYIQEYLDTIFSDFNPAKPAKREFKNVDTISPFTWFPFIQLITHSPRLENEFWKGLEKNTQQILARYNQETYHADHVPNGTKAQPFTYLQHVLSHFPLVRTTTQQFMPASAVFAPSLIPVIGNTQPSAQIPVKLSPEMENFLGFKTALDIQACQTFLQNLKKSYKHDLYKYVMDQLLQALRKADTSQIEYVKKLEFQTASNEWKPAYQLKAWAITHTPVPETSEWLKEIFNAKENEEFCSLLKIQVIREDLEINHFADAEECLTLKTFLYERIHFMAYFWNTARNYDKDPKEAVNEFFVKINRLDCFIKKDESGIRKPILKDQKLLVFDDWRTNKERIAKQLSKYLGLTTKVEKTAISKSLGKDWDFRDNSKDGKNFQPYKEIFLLLCEGKTFAPESNVNQKEEEVTPPNPPAFTPPPTPKKEPESPISDIEKTPKQPTKTTWSPQTPPQEMTETPSKTLPPRPDWQPIFPVGGSGGQGKSKRGSMETEGGLSDLAKKRIGLWAEEHILARLVEKYKKICGDMFAIDKGTRTLTDVAGKKTCTIVWHNDPLMRPDDQKDNELWDSGQHYDIELVYKEEGKADRIRKYEVKGTPGPSVHFYLSGLEWQTYLSNPNQFRIRVVTKAGTKEAQITKIKDLLKNMREKSLIPISTTEFKG